MKKSAKKLKKYLGAKKFKELTLYLENVELILGNNK